MQEWEIAYVNQREIPVLISDEKEALLAAKAAGRAIVGLWRPGQAMDEISAAKYVVENPEDVTEDYLERVALDTGIPSSCLTLTEAPRCVPILTAVTPPQSGW